MATRIYEGQWIFDDSPKGAIGPVERWLRKVGPQGSGFTRVEAWEHHVARVRFYEQNPDIET